MHGPEPTPSPRRDRRGTPDLTETEIRANSIPMHRIRSIWQTVTFLWSAYQTLKAISAEFSRAANARSETAGNRPAGAEPTPAA